MLYEAAINPNLFWLYAPFALGLFGVGVYLYLWAVDNTNKALVAVQRTRAHSKFKTEKEVTKRAELKHQMKIVEGQNIQNRRQAESEKTVHKGIRRLFE